MAAAAILDFQKVEILTDDLRRFNGFFQNDGRPPSWISWAPIGTTHDDLLMVSIVVQYLFEIDAVLSII